MSSRCLDFSYLQRNLALKDHVNSKQIIMQLSHNLFIDREIEESRNFYSSLKCCTAEIERYL